MGAGAGQGQRQDIFLNFVNQKPVRLNVTFPVPAIIPGQRMIPIALGKRNFRRQQGDDLFQQVGVTAAFQGRRPPRGGRG